MKKKKSKRNQKDSGSDDNSSDSGELKKGRKSHKEKKRSKKDKDKRRDRHYKNIAIKKEPSSSSSESVLSDNALEKLLDRRIEFAGPNGATGSSGKWHHHARSDGSSDRDHRKTNRMKVERDKLHKEEIRKRGDKSVNGIKHSRDESKHGDERNHRKRMGEGNDNSYRKKQKQ
jgi:hypothetical protein